MAFARIKGKMQVGTFKNKENGEIFKSCIFTDANDNRCFVAFSSKLGELTPAEIAERKHDLQVVQLDTGTYSLCEKGEGLWEDVEL